MKSYALQIPFASCETVKTPEWNINLNSAIKSITMWRRRARQRALLSSLDARLLEDIGINPLDAAHESSKNFWQI